MEEHFQYKTVRYISGENNSAVASSLTKEACLELLKCDRIAEEAYLITEGKNFTAGRELDDWLNKEAELTKRLHNALHNKGRFA